MYIATLPVEHQIIAEVLNRNIPAIKPDDIVVTNSKVSVYVGISYL